MLETAWKDLMPINLSVQEEEKLILNSYRL